MKQRSALEVWLNNLHVGTLALTKDRRAAFEYSDDWLKNGFSISPFSLPLRPGVFIPESCEPFQGLFGVFADSLPDSWGTMLTDSVLKQHSVNPESLNCLSRLAVVGNSGKGALEYRPSCHLTKNLNNGSLKELSDMVQSMLINEDCNCPDRLFRSGGFCGGARPKISCRIDGSEWIVKYPSKRDNLTAAQMEFDYMRCARDCGLDVPEIRIIRSENGPDGFAVRRFDRQADQKIFMISASGLLESSHHLPVLDYSHLFRLTSILCRDQEQIWKLYRMMCFNVFAHNRDDHSRNFSFLYQNGKWMLSPVYDLTYSSSYFGEHATSVNGNGRDPGLPELLALAQKYGLPGRMAKETAEHIRQTIQEQLKDWIA